MVLSGRVVCFRKADTLTIWDADCFRERDLRQPMWENGSRCTETNILAMSRRKNYKLWGWLCLLDTHDLWYRNHEEFKTRNINEFVDHRYISYSTEPVKIEVIKSVARMNEGTLWDLSPIALLAPLWARLLCKRMNECLSSERSLATTDSSELFATNPNVNIPNPCHIQYYILALWQACKKKWAKGLCGPYVTPNKFPSTRIWIEPFHSFSSVRFRAAEVSALHYE